MAGRNVGSISVTVDADTSKLKVQLVAAGEEGGEGAKEAIDDALGEIGGPQLKAAITKIRNQLERGLSGIEAEVNAQVSEGSIARASEELEFAFEGIKAALGVELEDGDVARVEAELADLGDQATATVGVDLEDGDLAKAEIVLSELGDHATANVNVDIDKASKAKADAELRANFSSVGTEAGQGFSRNFGSALDGGGGGGGGLSTRMQAIAAGIVLLMEPAAVALEGLASGAIQVLSSAFSALATTGGVLLPIMAGLGATLGAVGIASLGVGKGISAVTKEFAAAAEAGRAFNINAAGITKAMGALGPAAQGVVRAFADLFPTLQKIQDTIAENVFAGFEGTLNRLAHETIPDVGEALARAGTTANTFFQNLASAIGDIDFAHTFSEISPALDALGIAIANVVRAIQPFFEAAAPAAREFAGMIERASEALLRLVEAGNQSGAIARFFDQGLDSLRVWGDLLANVTRALFTLFEAGTAGGNSLIQSLSNIIGRFNDWMNTIAGQSALEEFFNSGREALSALTPLLQGLVGFFDNIVSEGAIDRFRELSEAIGTVLPVLGSLFEIVGRVGVLDTMAQALAGIATALEPAIPALQQLASALGDALGDTLTALQPRLDALGEAIGQTAEAIAPLVPVLAEVAVALLEAWTPVVIANTQAFADIMTALAPLIELVLQAALPIVQVIGELSKGFALLTQIMGGAIVAAIDFLVGGFVRLADAAQTFLDLLGKIPFLGAFLDWLGLTSDESDQAAESVDHLAASADDLSPAIQDAATVIEDAATAAENATTGTDLLEASYADLVPAINDAAAAVEGYTDEGLAKVAAQSEKARKANDKLKVSLLETEGVLRDMESAFATMARREDALSRVFDLGNAPEDAATATRDILEGVADAKKALKENGIKAKDVIDVKTGEIKQTLKADPFLDAIDDLRPQIQEKLTQSFAFDPTGETARAQALTYIKQVTDALGGAFTPQQVAQMLGLDNFEQTITIAVELSQVEEAKAELDALTGLGGETPLTATIGLALDKGTLSGDAAQAILNELAIAQGIPAEVLPEVTPEGMEQARAFLAANPGLLPVDIKFPEPIPPVPTPAPVLVPVEFDIAASDVGVFLDSTAGPAGALSNFSETVTIPIIGDPTEFNNAVGTVQSAIGNLNETTGEPTITADTDIPTENIEGLIGELGVLNTTTAKPEVSVPAYNDVFSQLSDLNSLAFDFDSLTPDAVVSLSGYDTTVDNIDHIIDRANVLDGKTIDVFIVQHGSTAFASGGIVGAMGGIGGEAGPELAFFRGTTRLLTSPTKLQPGTVVIPLDSSSTGMSSASSTPVIAKQVNNYMTFEITTADPEGVATSVMNRAAAAAANP